MKRLRILLVAHGLDVVIVALACATALSAPTWTDAFRSGDVRSGLVKVSLVVMPLALLLRRRAPFAIPAGTWLLSAVLAVVDGSLVAGQAPISIVGMVAAVLLGDLRDRGQARIGLVVVVASAATVVHQDPGHTAGNVVFVPGLFAVGWLAGSALHRRTEQTEAAEELAALSEWRRQHESRVAVAEERARIARELHDVVAHAVSVMVLQVGALRHRLPAEDDVSRETLLNVEQAGRNALTEMRRLLDAMRREGDHLDRAPQAGLDRIDTLLDDVRAAGLDVRVEVHGDPVELPPGLDLSAYRVIQEGLTNVIKHARTRDAELLLRYGARHLELEVRDNGVGPGPSDGLGHGLVGVRERVKLCGGTMTAGVAESGGFALRAVLPMDRR